MEAIQQPAGKKRVVTVYGVAATLILLAMLMSSCPGHGSINTLKRAKLANEFSQVQTAVLNYYTEFSEYPVAPHNASLVKPLTGDNPRKVEFLALSPSDQNAKGEMLDPWGTPIQISVDTKGNLSMRSAGPDKIFGTADDITNQ